MMKDEIKNNLFLIILVAVMSASCKQPTATALSADVQELDTTDTFPNTLMNSGADSYSTYIII